MRRVVATLAAAVVAVTGVGLAGVPAGAADEVDSCDLLTRKEITQAFGQRARAGDDDLIEGVCQWRLKRSEVRSPGQVNAMVIRGADARAQFRLAQSLFSESNVAIDGLGREALYSSESGVVWVLVDNRTAFYVQGNVYDADANRITDGLQDTLTTLATTAEARL